MDYDKATLLKPVTMHGEVVMEVGSIEDVASYTDEYVYLVYDRDTEGNVIQVVTVPVSDVILHEAKHIGGK